GHDQQPVFGAGKELEPKEWQSIFRQITASGLVIVDHEAHGALQLAAEARAVFRGERRVILRKDREQKAAAVNRSLRQAVALPEAMQQVFGRRRAERTRLARQQGVPPYVVFQDTTLRAMAMEQPRTLEELMALPGIGQAKLERYGAAFLAVLDDVQRESGG